MGTITHVNFSFAIEGGMWVRRTNGTAWESFSELLKELGRSELDRLFSIAYHGGMTGMWYAVN